MKANRLIVMGLMAMSLMSTTQAAVVGTVTNDIDINKSESEDCFEASTGDLVEIVKQEDDGYVVLLKNNETQFISEENIELEGTVGRVTVKEASIRETADEKGDIIKFASEGEPFVVTLRQDDFYKVEIGNSEGYIAVDELEGKGLNKLEYIQTAEEEMDEEEEVFESESSSKGEEVIAYAKKFLGGRYVYGGNNLSTGVDCSGFTQQIMKKFNVNLERSSRSQYASNGVKVSESNLQPGDLVFYGNNGVINHVAIYAGNNQIIHASDARSGIKMSKLHYGKPIIGMKRVLS